MPRQQKKRCSGLYTDSSAKPLRSVLNSTAEVTAGTSVVKMLMYVQQASELKLGRSYILRNYCLGMIFILSFSDFLYVILHITVFFGGNNTF